MRSYDVVIGLAFLTALGVGACLEGAMTGEAMEVHRSGCAGAAPVTRNELLKAVP